MNAADGPSRYRALLVDDEPLALSRMTRLLKPFGDRVEIVANAQTVAQARTKFKTERPNLVFLDIQLPDGTGFDLVPYLDPLPAIIFSTAYDEFALKAFEANAIDYLLKPVQAQRLNRALDKLDRQWGEQSANVSNRLAELLRQVAGPSDRKFMVRTGDRIKFLDYDTIYFFKATDKYVEVCTKQHRYLTKQTLQALEQQLSSCGFWRIHRSVLVNKRYVEEIGKAGQGRYFVRLQDFPDVFLPMSRKVRQHLEGS